ncbi:conserved protein of unknown function [Paraburkholderia kururiensis]|jgi:hypothetical protein
MAGFVMPSLLFYPKQLSNAVRLTGPRLTGCAMVVQSD